MALGAALLLLSGLAGVGAAFVYAVYRLVIRTTRPALSVVEYRLLDAIDQLALRVDLLSEQVDDLSHTALTATSTGSARTANPADGEDASS